jgi:competence ComEA-like helix-hairpin-helix protein
VGNKGNLALLLWVVIVICTTVLGFRWWTVAGRVPLGGLHIESAAGSSGPEPSAEVQARNIAAPDPPPAAAAAPERVNLNSATLSELERLPGIGPVLGQRIIDYRKQHGPFSAVAGLLQVSGIGEKKLEQLQHLVYVSSADGSGP